MPKSASINQDEIAHFSSQAQDWWNPHGALGALHKLNPTRMEYIRDTVCEHFKRSHEKAAVFKGLSVLDIGCGGGLLCEPLARLGATVTGLDASVEAIKVAKAHAKETNLKVTYYADSAEDFSRQGKRFDIITVLEILEHVDDIGSLLHSAAALLKPGGIVILSTLNRTMRSYLLGIIAAEYILGWVQNGTHDWRKFIRPSELAVQLEKVGLNLTDITGMIYNPLNDDFHLRRGAVAVNYLATAVK